MSAAVLAACGTQDESAEGQGASAEGESLRFLVMSTPDAADDLREQMAQFEQDTGITVTVETLPGGGSQTVPGVLRTEFVAGGGPDLFEMWGGYLGGQFVDDGWAADLTEYYEEYGWDDRIRSTAVEGMTYDGVTYAVPLYQNSLSAWYSLDAFEEAGASIPETYEELEEANALLVEAGYVPAALGGRFGWEIMRLFEYLLEVTAGPELHDQLLVGEASWDQPEVVEAFSLYKKWADEGWLLEGVLGLEPDDVNVGFVQGSSGYTIAGAWAEGLFITDTPDPSRYGRFTLPTGHEPERHSGFVAGYWIAENSENKDAAAQLLDFLAQADVQLALENSVTPVIGAEPDPADFPLSLENAEMAEENPFFPIMDQALPAEQMEGFFQVQSDILQGNITPEEAAAEMEEIMAQWASQADEG